jgi:molecular chaperone DnaK
VPQVEVAFDIDANGIVHVSAKDLGTGKEQNITITASSGLNDKDIERMVKEAESHRGEDQERRKQVEARNKLDSLVYSTEKTYDEHKEKLGPDEKGELERAMADAKKALEGDDAAQMDQAAERLTKASHKLAEVMYRQQQQGGGADPTPGGGSAGAGQPGGAGSADEVIDAEYVDVDEKR